jgi:hypothetical protein
MRHTSSIPPDRIAAARDLSALGQNSDAAALALMGVLSAGSNWKSRGSKSPRRTGEVKIMPTYFSKLVITAILCLSALTASGSRADSAMTSEPPGGSAAAAERVYLAAGVTDKDEEATIGDPDEQAQIGDPGEQSTVGDPGEAATIGDPGEKAGISDPDEESTIGDPGEKSKF